MPPRNDERLLRSQRAFFEHLRVSEIVGDDQAAQILGVDDSTVTRWRMGDRGAPLGVLDQLLAAIPPEDVAEVLRRYAVRHGNRGGKRVVVDVVSERDEGPTDGGLTSDALELAGAAGDVAREARHSSNVVDLVRAQHVRDCARAAGRAARRIERFAEEQICFGFDGARRQVR